MDNLSPKLLLKVAGYCDFAEICAMSKVNRQWNELIGSNWNSLKKANVESIQLEEDDYEMKVNCVIQFKDGRRKTLMLNIQEGSEQVDASELLENGWGDVALKYRGYEERTVKPSGKNQFLEDLFTPIFRGSAICRLELNSLKSSTLQVLISLLERFLPTIKELEMNIGCHDESVHCTDPDEQELTDSARIVELSKTGQLEFCISDSFEDEEVCELFMKKIANLYIPRVYMSLFDSSGIDEDCFLERNRPMGNGPLPKCRYLHCEGSESDDDTSALAVPDMVDLVEEWSKNERDIVRYEFEYFSEDIEVLASQFEHALNERNLPVRLEVLEENAEFLIKKTATRGDKQDELRLSFYYRQYILNDDLYDDEIDALPKTNFVVFRTNEDVEA